MQAKMVVCLSFMLVFWGNLVAADEAIHVRSVYSDQTGNVSIVVDVPPGVKPEASQFQLIEDSKNTVKASSIEPFLDSDWKLVVVFCIDKSGSISDAELEKTKTALKNLLRKPLFRQQDRLALVSFENESRVIQWFTQSQEIYKKINELKNMNGRHTVLYDTLFDSLGYVNSDSTEAIPPVYKHIVVITDGQNDGGLRQDITEVRGTALETGVAIDAVLLKSKRKNAETMQALANDTGGKFFTTDANGVGMALNNIFNEILSAYVVSFDRSINTSAPKTVRVGLQFQGVDGKSITDNVQARIAPTSVDRTPSMNNKTDTIVPTATDEKISKPTTPENHDGGNSNWIWLYCIFLLLAALLALAIWRTRRKPQIGPGDLEPEVGFDKKTPTLAPSRVVPHETMRRKTLVGSSSFPTLNPDSPIATLLCLSGPQEGQQFSIEKELFLIGANVDNDLRIAQDDYVSGDHAYLRYEKGSLMLFDEGSSNGTFVNDVRVTDKGVVLKPGEQIRIGTSVFEVMIPVA